MFTLGGSPYFFFENSHECTTAGRCFTHGGCRCYSKVWAVWKWSGHRRVFTILDVDCRHMNISPPDQLFGWMYPRKVHQVLARNFDDNANVICRCRKGPACHGFQERRRRGGGLWELELPRDCSRHLKKLIQCASQWGNYLACGTC